MINYQIQGNGEYDEEKMDSFLDFMDAGFENAYRGFDRQDWNKNISILNAGNYLEKLKIS